MADCGSLGRIGRLYYLIMKTRRDDSFELYDLRVEVIAGDRPMICGHKAGDSFDLSGERLSLPRGQSFSIYALAALLPLLPAKQRPTDPLDWMTTDAEVACPDPNCGARFRITRRRTRTFRHSETTVVPLGRTPAPAAERRPRTRKAR
jgi:uncharacterized repeat protein (TIGR04076 family)